MWLYPQAKDETLVIGVELKSLVGTWKYSWPFGRVIDPWLF
jgi:hypothetical protein